MTRSIADAVVIKREDLFFLCEPSGEVPCTEAHGFGLYYHDCRYLNGYVLRLFDRPLEVLGVDASAGFRASFQLTNPDLHDIGDDHRLIAKETIALKWERTIDVPSTMLVDVIEVNNFGTEGMEVKVSVELRAQFEALFDVRGTQPKQRGTLHAPLRFRFISTCRKSRMNARRTRAHHSRCSDRATPGSSVRRGCARTVASSTKCSIGPCEIYTCSPARSVANATLPRVCRGT